MSRTRARERFITMAGVLPHRAQRRVYVPTCPNDELMVVENGIEIKSVVANIRVIEIMHKFSWPTVICMLFAELAKRNRRLKTRVCFSFWLVSNNLIEEMIKNWQFVCEPWIVSLKGTWTSEEQEAAAPNVRVLSYCDVICIANANTSHTHHRDPGWVAPCIHTNKSYDRHPRRSPRSRFTKRSERSLLYVHRPFEARFYRHE